MGQSGAKPNKVNVKASCQMAISRMNIHKGKKQNEILKKKQEIANLLKNGNEDLAKIKVESVIREENTIIAYDIISQMVDVCSERTDFLIDLKREIPSDMWPHLQTIYYAGPRLDIPELNQFCSLMQKRCQGLGNQLVKEKLELCLYEEEIKVMKLKEIASQYKVEYVPKSDPFKALREDPLPPPSVPQMQPQFQPQNQGNIVISTGNQGEVQIQLQPNNFQQPMQGYPQPYQFGMQPQFQLGMQPTIQAGMQVPMQQGLQPPLQPGMQPLSQPGMQPQSQLGMQPQSQPGMFQQGNQYPQIPQVPQNDLNQQQKQQNFGDIPSVPTGFQQPNFQQGKNPGPPGQAPNPF